MNKPLCQKVVVVDWWLLMGGGRLWEVVEQGG